MKCPHGALGVQRAQRFVSLQRRAHGAGLKREAISEN